MAFSSLPSTPGVAGGKSDYVFLFQDTLEISVDHLIPIHMKRQAVRVSQLDALLQVGPVGRDVIIGFYKNGVLFGTVTIEDGDDEGTTILGSEEVFEAGDRFTIKILQTGLSVIGTSLSAFGRVAA